MIRRWVTHHRCAAVGLFLLVLLFVAPALRPGYVLLPLDIVVEMWPPWQQPNQPVDVHNGLLTDVVNYIYPAKLFAADAVRQGVLPLWNPYELTGYPFTYNTQAGLFYPLTLFYYLLPPATAVDLTIITQMCLGAWFMYLYLRQINLRHLAALCGAIIFTFNGLMVVWLEWQVVHTAVIWLPLALYALERLFNAPSSPTAARWAILASIAFALPWLGGHWNWALYSSMTFVVYLLWRMGQRGKGGWTWPSIKAWQLATLSFSIGIGLTAIQVLPALNYLRQSHRQPFTWAESQQLGLLDRFVVALIPDFFGTPLENSWWGG